MSDGQNQGADYSACWASVLADCAGGMTKEHSISRNQFGEGPVTVQGYSWCLNESRTVGIDSLVSRNLCRHHNNSSSPLDAAAGATLQAFRAMAERSDLVKGGAPRQPRSFGSRVTYWNGGC
jgi:hypothetical protein